MKCECLGRRRRWTENWKKLKGGKRRRGRDEQRAEQRTKGAVTQKDPRQVEWAKLNYEKRVSERADTDRCKVRKRQCVLVPAPTRAEPNRTELSNPSACVREQARKRETEAERARRQPRGSLVPAGNRPESRNPSPGAGAEPRGAGRRSAWSNHQARLRDSDVNAGSSSTGTDDYLRAARRTRFIIAEFDSTQSTHAQFSL